MTRHRRDEFIQLNRIFYELPDISYSNHDELGISVPQHVGKRLHWSDLHKEYRVILLSEAGSGKTTELFHATSDLRQKGKPAFFLRLEAIRSLADFQAAFEIGTFEEFCQWLRSNDPGWLLLDSVDEARLRDPKDFEQAIRILNRKLANVMDRTHIMISSRSTAWRPETDLKFCQERLPYGEQAETSGNRRVGIDNQEAPLVTCNGRVTRIRLGFKVVTLADLDDRQIASFAQARNVENYEDFLDQVKRTCAVSFITRPQDLEWLIEFWKDENRIGTGEEIINACIKKRLVERDQTHAEVQPLSIERAREGCKLLAAATTLHHCQTINVPDGVNTSKGIDVEQVLPDWDHKERSILLARPIFDVATYGVVRFHHRTIREYLTAEWFANLLNQETSRKKVESLFFKTKYDELIVVPTLRPIMPWLAIRDEKLRRRICEIAPEVIFEGGDPGLLPLEDRRNILRQVCEQIAKGQLFEWMYYDNAALQRFAKSDIGIDVCGLISQYADNNDVTGFLMRMVRLGGLEAALPQVMAFALNSKADRYTRSYAFRASKVIATDRDQERIRQSFLAEASELKRVWLSVLLEDLKPTRETCTWLRQCLEKSETPNPLNVDFLTETVTTFVSAATIELLPELIAGLRQLLSLPPTVERYHCEVSWKFRWLMAPAARAVVRLIEKQDRAALKPEVLLLLHNSSAFESYIWDINCRLDGKIEFSTLVPEWRKLNCELFWFQVRRSREGMSKKHNKRLTEISQLADHEPLWQFTEDEKDFVYACEQIFSQPFLDDKLVALSLAFSIYRRAHQPRPWLEQLKELSAKDNELSIRLSTYLEPPAQPRKRLRQMRETERRNRAEAEQTKQQKARAEWKSYLNEHLDEARMALESNPVSLYSKLSYLYQQSGFNQSSSSSLSHCQWRNLIPEYGEQVAILFRDGLRAFWRSYEPKLKSAGGPLDRMPNEVNFGLNCLELEAKESENWAQNLSQEEVSRACEYATFEVNGFPVWFPSLFHVHPQIAADVLIQEIKFELSTKHARDNLIYIIHNIACFGRWAWDRLAPSILDLLVVEPNNQKDLCNLLQILQGSNLLDESLVEIASHKCSSLNTLDHLALWFAVWVGTAPEDAIPSLKERLEQIHDEDQRILFAMHFVTRLWAYNGDWTGVRKAFKTPQHLKALYVLMLKYIHPFEDIERAGTGPYTRELRDDAQDARDQLFHCLMNVPGKEAYLAMREMAEANPKPAARRWMVHQSKTKVEHDADKDFAPWPLTAVRDFDQEMECMPRNHQQLADLAILRLLDLKVDLEEGDNSIAGIFMKIENEVDVRNLIGRELREKARDRYHIPQEEELADGKRIDLRFHGIKFDAPVPVELKLANRWSGPALFERLENQLCGDYLRDERSCRGIFLLVQQCNDKHWEVPGSNQRVDFNGLIGALQAHWNEIKSRFQNIENVTVIGIDLSKRSSRSSRKKLL